MPDAQALHKFLRDEFEAEARSGFARLNRIPDTRVRQFLDYYRSLNAPDQDALADASTLWGTCRLVPFGEPARRLQEALQVNPAWMRWGREVPRTNDRNPYRYFSVPALRTHIAQAKIDRAKGKRPPEPGELELYALSIRSVKAPELRKHVRVVMRSLLGARPSKFGGGDWDYEGTLMDSHVKVGIDYGGSSAQLRYEVGVDSSEPPVSFRRAGFEVVLGAGFGDWDFIVEENLNESMQLLAEVVTYVAELPKRLPEGCLEEPDT